MVRALRCPLSEVLVRTLAAALLALLCWSPLAALAAEPQSAEPARAAPRYFAEIDGREVDVTATMDRIANGGRNRHRNDGTRFQNRERRLPQGHRYTEYVVPTPRQRGPGPRRIVVDEAGKAYYTPDHYDHFYAVQKREQ